jgi:hypothetical protein
MKIARNYILSIGVSTDKGCEDMVTGPVCVKSTVHTDGKYWSMT